MCSAAVVVSCFDSGTVLSLSNTEWSSRLARYFDEGYRSVKAMRALQDYTADYWNALDWISYLMFTLALIAHFIDIGSDRAGVL